MIIFQHVLSRVLNMAFFWIFLLSPQYVLPQSKIDYQTDSDNIIEKLKSNENDKETLKVSLKKVKDNHKITEKLKSKEIVKEPGADQYSLHEELKFPKFNHSFMRTSENQAKYDRLYTLPTIQKKILELRQFKKKFETLYNKNQKYLIRDKNAPNRIPKIVHQIWLGSDVPEKFALWMSTWANMQGWEYKLWTDVEADQFPLYNRDLYEKAKGYGEKSDILRYEILFNHGGLYVDVDFKNINTQIFDQFNQSYDFYVGLEPMEHRQPINSPLIGNAIMASIPGHPLMEKVILEMDLHYTQNETSWAVVTTGPVYLTKQFHEYNQSQDNKYINIVLPPTFFFPLSYSDVRDNLNNSLGKFIKPETAAIHFWSGSWIENEIEGEVKPIPQPRKKKKRSPLFINRKNY
ncbi:MAG: hypothetical protein H0X29_03970 [Parachlamydiaceae bacterium]|nr:hypothetical protein [Parachlamydiaceae bacterium]